MGVNPFIGVVFHWIGGFCSATNFIPFRGIRRWSWEIYWIVQGIAAWLIAPTLIAMIFVPHVFTILHNSPTSSLGYAVFWGVLWGVGGLTFGLAIRYLGFGLGYAIALGLCMAFGTLMPPIFHGEMGEILHSSSGQMILLGVFICLVAVAISGAAGYSKEHEISDVEKAEAGVLDYSLGKGLAVAIFAGIMSACFAFGLDAGTPIAAVARGSLLAEGRLALWQNLPVLIVVLWGGFFTNFAWSVILIVKNHSVQQFAGQPGVNPFQATHHQDGRVSSPDPRDGSPVIGPSALVLNYLLAAAAGVIWYFQFFFYSMGETEMGKYTFSSWTIHMASIIIFATLWGIALREWNGTSRRTKWLVSCGLFLLVSSTVVVGYGNFLKMHGG